MRAALQTLVGISVGHKLIAGIHGDLFLVRVDLHGAGPVHTRERPTITRQLRRIRGNKYGLVLTPTVYNREDNDNKNHNSDDFGRR